MKVLVLIVVVVLVIALVVAVARAAQARSGRTAAWELEERSDGRRMLVRAVRPGERPLEVGAAAFDDPEFELRIEELRAEGRSRLIALNSGRGIR